jgi:hypothetical protein
MSYSTQSDIIVSHLKTGVTGIFFANFIADIQSYSKLKILYFFPIRRKKFPVVSYKNKTSEKQILKSLKIKGIFDVLV